MAHFFVQKRPKIHARKRLFRYQIAHQNAPKRVPNTLFRHPISPPPRLIIAAYYSGIASRVST